MSFRWEFWGKRASELREERKKKANHRRIRGGVVGDDEYKQTQKQRETWNVEAVGDK